MAFNLEAILLLACTCLVLISGQGLLEQQLLQYLSPDGSKISNKEVCFNNVTLDPEAYMTTVEIIRNRGYPAEVHHVQTEDGYILELHRIPHGLSGPSANRPPVFLQHGLFSQSSDFIVNFGNQSLGYMLADVGYDVFLGNYRGNIYSRKHVTLDPDIDKEEFWNYSWQELGNYDLAACIDYVLNLTGFEQLTYFGHSMGTTGFFVLAANRTEYNAKIKTMVALAPVATFSTISPNCTLTLLAENVDTFETILNAIGYYEALPYRPYYSIAASTGCSADDTCGNASSSQAICGFLPDPDQVNTTHLPVITSYHPAGQSIRDVYHYGQVIRDRPLFRAYDHGIIKNNQIYGQDEPPPYDLTKITAPIVLVWGDNDALALAGDVALLAETLPNVVLNFRVDYALWNHVDYIWAIEAERLQNKPIVDFLLRSVARGGSGGSIDPPTILKVQFSLLLGLLSCLDKQVI